MGWSRSGDGAGGNCASCAEARVRRRPIAPARDGASEGQPRLYHRRRRFLTDHGARAMADVPNETVVYLNRDFAPLGEAIGGSAGLSRLCRPRRMTRLRLDTSEPGGHDPPRARVEYGRRHACTASRQRSRPSWRLTSSPRRAPRRARPAAFSRCCQNCAASSETRLRAIAHPADRDEEGALRRQVPLQ